MAGLVIFEKFEDFGNAPEFVVDDISAFEVLDGNRIRVFATRFYRGQFQLAYTTVLSLAALERVGVKCAQISCGQPLPDWAIGMIRTVAS